jgi:hypothetical protein
LAGKKNVIADALSRFPVAAAVTHVAATDDALPEDPAIVSFAKASTDDEELKALAGVLRACLRAAQLPAT